MAIDASGLPALFTGSTWESGGSFDHSGSKLLASIDGVWVETVDPDGVHVEEADFDAVAGATPNMNGTLQIAGETKIVAARAVEGVRWIFLVDPE